MKLRRQVLGALFLLSIITFLDRVCMNVTGTYVKKDLQLNNAQFSYILGAFSLAYALFELPTGLLGDKLGARKILTRVVLWWSSFTALTGAAFNFLFLLIVRFLLGAGEAGAYPNASIVISRWFPAVETGRAQSAIWAAARLGGALTPLVVLPLVHAVGWRMAFVMLGMVGAIWSIWWFNWFRDEPAQMKTIGAEELQFIEANRTIKHAHTPASLSMIAKHKNIWMLMLMCHLFFYELVIYLLPGRKRHDGKPG